MSGFLWRLKTKVFTKNAFLADKLVNADTIASTDERIADQIEGYQYEEVKIENFRKEHASNILKLKGAMDRTDARTAASMNAEYRNNVKQYEKDMKRQLMDIQKIIQLSKSIINNEYLSILYDIRRPMMLLDQYKRQLKDNLRNVAINDRTRVELERLLIKIDEDYDNVIRHTIDLCGQVQKMGSMTNGGSMNIANSIDQRAKIKRQLNGRALAVINHVKRLEKYFSDLRRKKVLTEQEAAVILDNIRQFKEQFNMLSDLTRSRTESSENMIKETILLQKKKMEELRRLHDEIQTISPNLGEKSKIVLKECNELISAVEKEDAAAMREEENAGTQTAAGLASDESRLHSEGPSSIEAKNTGTPLSWFRKKWITWGLIGAMTFNQAASTASGISAAYAMHKAPIEQKIIVNSTKEFEEDTRFNFSVKFDNKEGIVSESRLRNELKTNIPEAIKEAMKQAKDSLKTENIDYKVTFLPGESVIIGHTCPEGQKVGGTATRNNDALGGLRAENASKITKEELVKMAQDSIFAANGIDSIKIFHDVIYDDPTVEAAVTNLNNYTRSIGRTDLLVDYSKMRRGDGNEVYKFDVALRIMKSNDEKRYEKEVKGMMDNLRRADIHLAFKVEAKALPGPIIFPLPPADTPVREGEKYIAPNVKRGWFVPQDNTKNYKLQGYTRTNGGGITSTYGKGGNKHFVGAGRSQISRRGR